MSVKYLKSLLFKAAQLQNQITAEQLRQRHDWIRLLRLKKIRLAIANKIQRLSHHGRPERSWQAMQPAYARPNTQPIPHLSSPRNR